MLVVLIIVGILVIAIESWCVIAYEIAEKRAADTMAYLEQEDAADPCSTCLRWDECQGVDDECSLRK